MLQAAGVLRNKNFLESGNFETKESSLLKAELEKGVRSLRNGEVYTIEEAWEEIDKI